MAIKFVDRVPTYPNRIKFTAEDGTVKYGVWERADSPTVVGTPINAANLNAMQQSSGLTASMMIYVSTSGSDNTGNGSSSAPYATITKALNTIPKNLNGYTATINIATGTYYEDVTINGYIGGNVVLTGSQDHSVSINSLQVIETDFVQVSNILLTLSAGTANGALYIRNSACIIWKPVSMLGVANRGIYCTIGGSVYISSAIISEKTDAVFAEQGGSVHVSTIGGSANATGLRAVNGATISYINNSMISTVATATFNGGRILSGAQTSIPNY